MNDGNSVPEMVDHKGVPEKRAYEQPLLRIYGKIQELTRNVVASSGEGMSGMGMG